MRITFKGFRRVHQHHQTGKAPIKVVFEDTAFEWQDWNFRNFVEDTKNLMMQMPEVESVAVLVEEVE